MLTPIERVAACLEVAQRHEHNEPYFKELVAEARTWSQIARNTEQQIQRAITLDAARPAASRPLERRS